MRLIDADELKATIKAVCCHSEDESDLLDAVEQIPSVEVVHGYWNFSEVNGLSVRICSVCNKKFYIVRGWNYCPNCGAKMDGADR